MHYNPPYLLIPEPYFMSTVSCRLYISFELLLLDVLMPRNKYKVHIKYIITMPLWLVEDKFKCRLYIFNPYTQSDGNTMIVIVRIYKYYVCGWNNKYLFIFIYLFSTCTCDLNLPGNRWWLHDENFIYNFLLQ